MIDKPTYLQILGSLMKNPHLLAQTDKYNLTIDDFSQKFFKYIFRAIESLKDATRITPIDIENVLSENAAGSAIFKNGNGIEWLQDAEFLANEENFPYYYKKLKKINLLNSLSKMGVDISSYYVENPLDDKAIEINNKFEDLEIDDIIEDIKKKLLHIEHQYAQNATTEVSTAFLGIDDIIQASLEQTDVGLPLQGQYFNEIVAGARKGKLYIRSAASGVGKTRQAVGDACLLAYPVRFNPDTWEWEQTGNSRRILFIATEQEKPEIQRMILAYLTGFNETKFRYGTFNESELSVLRQALKLMEVYQENFYIVRMPEPTIGLLKNTVRENVLVHDIEYVFYDYIFIGPAVLSEFKGYNLRNDEILLMMATALKDLAVELQVFIMTSTQVSAASDDDSKIRNESSIAGARAIINKADIGVIAARPSIDQLNFIEKAVKQLGFMNMPNMCTDVYKVRSGEYTQVRIWSYVDLGTLRKEDYFVTNNRFEVVDIQCHFIDLNETDKEELKEIMTVLGGVK